ncbi:DC-STAMP domain-containing protein 2-like [Liolophura sinensis]|uniref:DC-STAMP domain-containing protein 2-like n=1 Tax=Liolophura sinensis TaxID=3198878 RepID=UPI003159238A
MVRQNGEHKATSTAGSRWASIRQSKLFPGAIGILGGILGGGFLFMLLVLSYDYSPFVAGIISAVVTLAMCVAMAFSHRARCTCLLVLPSLATGRGRAAIFSLITALLLQGPVLNLNFNVNEMAASLSCGTELAYNQSRELQELLRKPIEALNNQIMENVEEFRAVGSGIRGVVNAVESATQRAQNSIRDAVSAATSSCRKAMNNAANKCSGNVDKVIRDCEGKLRVPVFGSVTTAPCKPLNAVRKSCSAVGVVDGVCNIVSGADVAINRALQTFTSGFSAVRNQLDFGIQQDAPINNNANISRTAQEITAAIKAEFAQKTDSVRLVVSIASRVMAAFLLVLFLNAALYLRSYLFKDKHDNIYITRAFIDLDERKTTEGQSETVLPLTSNERNKYITVRSWRLSPFEKRTLLKGLGMFFLHLLISLTVCSLDYVLYWAMEIIRDQGQVVFSLTGDSSVLLKVTGNGIIAQFIRTFVQGFSEEFQYNSTISTAACLPAPRPTPNSQLYTLASLYLLTLLLVILQSYGLRIRHCIASLFYPEREKERVLYLRDAIFRKRSYRKSQADRINKEAHSAKMRAEKFRLPPRGFPWKRDV